MLVNVTERYRLIRIAQMAECKSLLIRILCGPPRSRRLALFVNFVLLRVLRGLSGAVTRPQRTRRSTKRTMIRSIKRSLAECF
jgi:hypothetical protein